MTTHTISPFTETELWLIRSTAKERYGHDVTLEVAECEARLQPEDRDVTPCPAVFWSERGANFMIIRLGESRYRCQFYYRGFEQYGTGHETYDDLLQCVITLLQVQADHEGRRAQNPPPPAAGEDAPALRDPDNDLLPRFWGD